uniref:Uncharacterized protein n=1 Tax=Glossina palpalis gambiensis TaxID=67801 RepID=A0A1B0BJK7_9MUSC
MSQLCRGFCVWFCLTREDKKEKKEIIAKQHMFTSNDNASDMNVFKWRYSSISLRFVEEYIVTSTEDGVYICYKYDIVMIVFAKCILKIKSEDYLHLIPFRMTYLSDFMEASSILDTFNIQLMATSESKGSNKDDYVILCNISMMSLCFATYVQRMPPKTHENTMMITRTIAYEKNLHK